MVATNSDYTGSEIAAIIGWRYVRNNQDRWHTSQIAEEFDLHRGTVRGIFSKLRDVIAIESRKVSREAQNGYLQPMREYVLSGDPIPANGKPLSTQAGAFVIACLLARWRWCENSTLADLARWNRKRTAQVVLYRMSLLPLARYSRSGANADILWVVMN